MRAIDRHNYPSSRSMMLGTLLWLNCIAPICAQAQMAISVPAQRIEPTRPLALPPQGGSARVLTSTGFFADEAGHVLTAGHAVENCTQIIVAKEKYRLAAKLVARSPRYDLALLKIPRTLGLAAVFPQTVAPGLNTMVFAGAYTSLSDAPANRGLLANARVVSSFGGSEAGHLVIDSPAGFGTSGAPVLDGLGLVQGVVSRRTMVNRVLAVGTAETKAFLASNNVHFAQDDRPQLAPAASRASRAASVSAQVTCLQN